MVLFDVMKYACLRRQNMVQCCWCVTMDQGEEMDWCRAMILSLSFVSLPHFPSSLSPSLPLPLPLRHSLPLSLTDRGAYQGQQPYRTGRSSCSYCPSDRRSCKHNLCCELTHTTSCIDGEWKRQGRLHLRVARGQSPGPKGIIGYIQISCASQLGRLAPLANNTR